MEVTEVSFSERCRGLRLLNETDPLEWRGIVLSPISTGEVGTTLICSSKTSALATSVVAVGMIFLPLGPSSLALELEGYTEPLRTINVASDEAGTIAEVLVREGQAVAPGEPLVRLNSDVHRSLLAIAEQGTRAHGRLDAAAADLRMREERLNKLTSLRDEGHARQEEVDRAHSEVEVARANVRAAQDDLATRRLEYEKIRVQIARRTIRAPIGGVVTKLLKDQGEYVAPNSPDVATLVDIKALVANFTLLTSQTSHFKPGQQLVVEFFESSSETTGTVDLISPVTDAQSGTVLMQLRIDNTDGRFRSGERCKIRLD